MLGLWKHRVPALAAAVVVAALVVGSSSAASQRVDPLLAVADGLPGQRDTDGSPLDQMSEMACLVAFARGQAGASQLHESKTLDRAATLKIDADIRCGQFSHTPCSEQFESTFVAAGYSLGGNYSIGENLAFGQNRAGLAAPDHGLVARLATAPPEPALGRLEVVRARGANRQVPRLRRRRDLGQRVRQSLR